ncbi:hypothetical protein [Falsirhodobacter halotolerans]|uniref:hypothetical protein n=1 Tax=Falsirhodobacter halotolerans TaxID=1146892 RepID=UPI001FD354BE|nr:hypothetical protein [Falsirhodobacter halotolerans]MCJ8141070.1 hypothetical protein [Falsirhodobacter halotolerans]
MTPHPLRLARHLGRDVPETLAARLLAEARFADRIATLFPEGEPLGDPDARIAAMDMTALDRLALRAGAVIHADRLLREIRGPVIADWTARFGADALALARAHADLALARPETALAEEDGRACLGAWIAALPPAAKARLSLLWPDEDAVPTPGDAVFRDHGPVVIRRLAEAV